MIIDSLLMPVIPNTGCAIASRDPVKFVTNINNLKSQTQGFIEAFKSQGVDTEFIHRFFERYPDIHFDSMPSFNFFTSVDPDEKNYLLGILISEQMSGEMKSMFGIAVHRVLEGGFHLRLKERLRDFDVLADRPELSDSFGEKQRSRLYLAKECASCTIIQPDLEFHPLTLGNFTSLLRLMAILLSVFLALLIIETLTAAYRR